MHMPFPLIISQIAVAQADQCCVNSPAREERARCAAILTSIEARSRYERAQHFAFNTNFSAETAIMVLATEA